MVDEMQEDMYEEVPAYVYQIDELEREEILDAIEELAGIAYSYCGVVLCDGIIYELVYVMHMYPDLKDDVLNLKTISDPTKRVEELYKIIDELEQYVDYHRI